MAKFVHAHHPQTVAGAEIGIISLEYFEQHYLLGGQVYFYLRTVEKPGVSRTEVSG